MKTFMQILENNAQQQQFLNQIVNEYPNTQSMQIYADWLEEQGNPLAQIYRQIAQNEKIFLVTENGTHLSSRMNVIQNLPMMNLEQVINTLVNYSQQPNAKITNDSYSWTVKTTDIEKRITIKIRKDYTPQEIHDLIEAIRKKQVNY